MGPDGELLVGAAAMALGDVLPAMIMPHLDPTAALVIDANFPEDVVLALARSVRRAGRSLPPALRLARWRAFAPAFNIFTRWC